ncbi:aminoacyl-tRNA deacylase [Gorillibacterium timonense]|uniref:aminoacyl-tRNA deacylase n=1 Tax=Gorillibacterium timonense TaxID=1689269 RepID=UPI00071D3EC3|nr:YbaK/EbsC family protein [Gorillibacterium timonense]
MNKVVQFLDSKEVLFEIITQERTLHSAQEGADYFGISLGQTAPALLVKSEKGYACLILSGDRGPVNWDELKLVLGVEGVKLAKPKEVEQVTGSSVGDVALIQPELPVVIDRRLFRYDLIYGGTGSPRTTLKISPKDVERLHTVVGYL